MKAAERKIEAAKAYAESIIATVKQPLAVLDEDLRMVSASASFFKVFDGKPEDRIGKPFTLASQPQPEILVNFLAAANGAARSRIMKLVSICRSLGRAHFS